MIYRFPSMTQVTLLSALSGCTQNAKEHPRRSEKVPLKHKKINVYFPIYPELKKYLVDGWMVYQCHSCLKTLVLKAFIPDKVHK